MTYQVSTTQWLQLSKETREALALKFHLTKRGHSVVHGGKIISDGYTNLDLQGITVEKINVFLGTNFVESDILKAFNDMVLSLEKPTENNESTDIRPSTDSGNGGEDNGTENENGSTVKEDSEPSGEEFVAITPKANTKASRSGKAK